jgi:hypothetical protein
MHIITGLGRCGTSILTKYLKEVGFGIGKNVNWYEKANAGYELSTFWSQIDDFYTHYLNKGKPINLDDMAMGQGYWKGMTYREILENVDKDERQGKVDLIKDPRLTWHPDIIETIYGCRPDLKLIICHRKPENVKKSRERLYKKYKQWHDNKPRTKIEDYKIDFCDFYTRVLELEIPHVVLFFPNYLKNYNKTYDTLQEIGLEFDKEKGNKKWKELIDIDLTKRNE